MTPILAAAADLLLRWNVLEKFIKTYSGTYTRTAMVRHKGVVIAFAMDKGRRIWYTILDLNGNIPEAGTDKQGSRCWELEYQPYRIDLPERNRRGWLWRRRPDGFAVI